MSTGRYLKNGICHTENKVSDKWCPNKGHRIQNFQRGYLYDEDYVNAFTEFDKYVSGNAACTPTASQKLTHVTLPIVSKKIECPFTVIEELTEPVETSLPTLKQKAIAPVGNNEQSSTDHVKHLEDLFLQKNTRSKSFNDFIQLKTKKVLNFQ